MTGIAQLMLGVSGGYDAAAQALFARMSPSIATDEKDVYNTAIVALKAAGIWSTLDCMGSFYAPHSQAALLNWTENDHNVTAVNSPTFTAYTAGYATNGTTQYLSIDYNPNTDGVNLTLNSATIACEVTAGTDVQSTTATIMGCSWSGTNHGLQIIPRSTTGYVRGRLNSSSSAQYITVAPATRIGLFAQSRTASNATEGYRNGSSVGTDSILSSIAPNTNPMTIACYNNDGVNTGFCANTFGAWALGGQWTGQQHTDFYNIMTTFRTSMAAL